MLRIISFSLIFTWATYAVALASQTFDETLSIAEQQRLNDPTAVSELIDELETRLQEASIDSRQRLIVLMSHQLALKGQLDSANSQLEQLLQAKISAEVRSRAYSLQAQIYNVKAEYVSSFEALDLAIRALIDVNDPKVKFDVLEVAARLFNDADESSKALQYGAEALAISNDLNDPLRTCTAWSGIAITNSISKNWQETINTAEKAEKFCSDHSAILLAAALNVKAFAKLHLNQPNDAYELAKRASSLFKSINYDVGNITSEIYMGQSLFMQGDKETATALLSTAAERAEQLGMLDVVTQCFTTLATIMESQGQWQKAAEYYKRLRSTELKNLDERRLIRTALLKVQFDSARQEQEISALEREKKFLIEQEAVQTENRRLLQFGVGAVSVVCILLLLALHRLRKQSLTLRHLAQVDSLTGLFNRRHAFMLAETLYAGCCRRNAPFAVVMVDLDLFKEINDSFGHAVGDLVLKESAQCFARGLRKQDVIGRTGGEEFALFLPDADLLAAQAVVDRCRSGLGEVREGARSRKITASFGIAVAIDGRYSLDELLKFADAALYTAKETGRDRVVVSHNLAMSPAALDEPASLI